MDRRKSVWVSYMGAIQIQKLAICLYLSYFAYWLIYNIRHLVIRFGD